MASIDDTITGNKQSEFLDGADGNDSVAGNGGHDTLIGGTGSDWINGGAGQDIMYGGTEDNPFDGSVDIFVYGWSAQSKINRSDEIYGFETGIDLIDLSDVDADTVQKGKTQLVYSEGAAANSVWIENETDASFVYADTSGDGVADMKITIYGDDALDYSDLTGVVIPDSFADGTGEDTLETGEDTLEGASGEDTLAADDPVEPAEEDTIQSGEDTVPAAEEEVPEEEVVEEPVSAETVEEETTPVEEEPATTEETEEETTEVEEVSEGTDDTLIGSKEGDFFDGENGNDTLAGNGGHDTLVGGLGADWINGGAGRDIMYGGTSEDAFDRSADIFVYGWSAQSKLNLSDEIYGFETGIDLIDLTDVDADTVQKGKTQLVYSEGAAANSVWIENDADASLVFADTSGDGLADMKIIVYGDDALDYSDLTGVSVPDDLMADTGDDTLGSGEDTLEGATGEDTLAADDPVEVVEEDTAEETDTGSGFRVVSPFNGGDYATALGLSMQFYYAQYSGELPDDFPIEWRGDSALDDGSDVGVDLSGGWYDAGDRVKFGLPMAYTTTMLAWSASDYMESYEAAGAEQDILTHLDWATDYLLRCYDDRGTADLSDDIFYAQVGAGSIDHGNWVSPEEMTMERPTYAVTAESPGTEVTAETVAAMAASAMVFAEAGNTAYADELIATAKQLFDFTEAYQGTYTDAVTDAATFYKSWSGYQDELAWAATWLYKATGESNYLEKAEAYYNGGHPWWAMTWDNKSNGVSALLAEETGKTEYIEALDYHLELMMTTLTRTPGTDTNDGLAWLQEWGSNRYAANMAFLSVKRAELAKDLGETAYAADLFDFATDQIDYILGDNPDEQSYLIGFGDKFPLNPHHAAASGTASVGAAGNNLYELTGALVGGPDVNGDWEDVRWDYVHNEVALDYNAEFSIAVASLVHADMFY